MLHSLYRLFVRAKIFRVCQTIFDTMERIFTFSKLLWSSTLYYTKDNINVIIYISNSVFVLTTVRKFPALSSVTG